MQLLFGIGALWGNRSDVPGVGPDQFGILQDNSIDFSFELKELYSQLQFPVDIARGKGKISGKAKMARVFGALYADLFFGSTTSVGETNVGENESHVLATNTVSVTNATGFLADLGVYYTDAGNTRLTFTTGAPSAGQYATGTNGTYTFNTGDIGKTVAISYCFTDANGLSITITNQFMGYDRCGGEGVSGAYGRDAKVFCRRCHRRLKTVKSQRDGLCVICNPPDQWGEDRKSTRLNSSHHSISYAVF